VTQDQNHEPRRDRPQGAGQALRLDPDGDPGERRQLRIALYSHDTQGLGHIRRNMLVAQALAAGDGVPILLLSGLREAAAFPMPEGVDCLTLPSLGKDTDGRYFPRTLGVSMNELIKVRRQTIRAVLGSFEPDVLIVDKVPLGAFEELRPSLEWLRSHGRSRIVLGLRDILDAPETVREEWDRRGDEAAIRHYCDQVWVYGDQQMFDVAEEYGLAADVASRVRYCGYLNPGHVTAPSAPQRTVPDADGPLMLCVVGGGRDGVPLAEAFLQAELPGSARGLLVTGPLMPIEERRRLRALATSRSRRSVLEFVTDPCPLLEQADRVIAMGGYNTMCEIMSFGKPALIVPRVEPRTEQLIRATRFAAHGLVNTVHPDELRPETLSRWLAQPATVPDAERMPRFDGVERLPGMLAALHAGPGQERSHAVT
jgi:predicted glycosyltransferase